MSEGALKIEEEKNITIASFLDIAMLDETSVKKLGDELETLIKGRDKITLVIDFSNIEFVSSAVLGRLVKVRKIIKSKDGKLALCSMKKDLKQVFKVTKLDRVLKIYDDRDKAIKSFKSLGGLFG